MTTFAEAQDIVRKQLADTPYLFVADWGNESDEYWQIMAGDSRYLVSFNADYALEDDRCFLVNKADGSYEVRAYVANMEFFDDFKPFGNIPAFFQ